MNGSESLCARVSVFTQDKSAVEFVESKGTKAKELLSKEVIVIEGREVAIYTDSVKSDLLDGLY